MLGPSRAKVVIRRDCRGGRREELKKSSCVFGVADFLYSTPDNVSFLSLNSVMLLFMIPFVILLVFN